MVIKLLRENGNVKSLFFLHPLFSIDPSFPLLLPRASVEMVGAEDPTEGVRAWALWRQSGHKGREWLTESVVVPPMPGVTRYKVRETGVTRYKVKEKRVTMY